MRRLLRKPLAVLCASGLVVVASASVVTAAAQQASTATVSAEPQVGADAIRDAALTGIVLDAVTREPIARATVTAGPTQVATGADGRFSLTTTAAREATLSVAASGYFTLTTTVSSGPAGWPTVELVMVRESSIVDEVFVRAPEPAGAPAARRVDPAEVLHTPGALDNIFRTLQTLPGVAAAQEALGYLTVRGGSPDQNLTLLDGVEVHDPYRLYGLTSAFNPEAIERFDLATGGFSAKYGDRLSSLLSVESRDRTTTQRIRGSGSMSVTDAHVVLEGALPGVEHASWLVNTRRTYYDLIANLVSDQQFPGFEDVQAKGVWTPRAGRKLTLFGLRSRQGGDLRINGNDINARFRDDTKNSLGWARYESTLGSRGHTMTVAGVSDTSIGTGFDGLFADKGRRSNAPGLLPARQANVGFGLDILVRDASLRQELGWAAHRHTLNAGFEAHRLTTTLGFSLRGDRNPNVSGSSIQGGAGLPDALGSSIRSTRGGAWVEDTWAIGDALSVQGGMRLDRVGATDEWLVSPRISASWRIGEATRLRTAVGRYTQSLGYEKLLQSDYLLDLTDPVAHGLRSQQAVLASAGLERDLGTSALVRVEGYYKRFDDLLVGQLESESERLARLGRYDFPVSLASSLPTDAIITAAPSNDGRGRAYGIDVLVQRHTASADTRLRGWASYTWGKAEREAYGLRYPFEYDRRHAFTVVAAYQLSPRWELATTTRIASGFPRTTPLGLRVAGVTDAADADGDGVHTELVPERDADGRFVYVVDFGGVANLQRGRLPLFARVDARVTWRPPSGRWELYGEVLNVLNRKNAGLLTPKLEHDPASDRPRLVEEREQSLPLLPTVGIRFRF